MNMADQEKQSTFSLDKIYVRDISLEVPNAPQIFLNREQPNIELNINFGAEAIEEGVYQVTIKAIVNAKIGEEQMFLIECDQAGIFQIRNIPDEQMELVKNIECPNLLFPYLREAISDLTTRAGFLPVIISPVNFAYLYQQKQAQIEGAVNQTVN